MNQPFQQSHSKRVAANGLRYALANGLSHVYLILSIPILMRALSADEWGFYTVLVQIGALVQVLGATAFSQALLRFYATTEGLARQQLVWSCIAGTAVTQGCLLGALWLGRDSAIHLLFSNITLPLDPVLGWACIWWFLATFRTLLMTFIKVQELPWRVIQLNGLYGILMLPGLFLVTFAMGRGLVGAVQALAVAEGAVAVVNLALIARGLRPAWDWPTLKKAVAFSLPLIPSALLTAFLLNADRMVLSRYVSLAEQGIYSLGAMLGGGMAVVVTSFWSSYSARVLSVKAKEGADAAAAVGRESLRVGIAFVALPVLALAVLAWPILFLLSGKPESALQASAIAVGIGVGHFCRFLVLPAQHALFMESRTWTILTLSGATLICMLLLSNMLAALVGMWAVSVAFALSHLGVAPVAYGVATKVFPVALPLHEVLKGGLVVFVAAAFGFVGTSVDSSTRLALWGGTIVVTALYVRHVIVSVWPDRKGLT